MSTFRNRFFVEGIVLGGLCGLVIGTIIAFQVGNEGVTAARRLANRLIFRQPQPVRFELLLQ
ncbi:MAG TPA: hypothetical protein VFU69_16460 [Ktedonobacterales bacterium]|nr:hypothetical protein [Ktedonobacterales bacterium]